MKRKRNCFTILILLAFSWSCCGSFDIYAKELEADLIIYNAKVVDLSQPEHFAEAVAVTKGKIAFVGSNQAAFHFKTDKSLLLDAHQRTLIPGLNDSHLHLIREGLNYNLELRWDGVRSLNRALAMLKEQGKRTPPDQWVRVVGGWNEFQFAEKRLPTLQEINAAVPDKPVFILYLYSKAFLNKKALQVLGYNKDTQFPGGEVELDEAGNPTGLLLAKPNAAILYNSLSQIPKLTREEQLNSTIHFFRELNRLGITSAIDAGGGGQNFPDDYSVAKELATAGLLSVRTSYYLFAQQKGKELQGFQEWLTLTKPGNNDDLFKPNGYLMHGAGENLTWAAADFENFLEPRPELEETMEAELEPIIELLAKSQWPFRIHATYNESIDRFLNVFEKVNRKYPFFGKTRWIIDHAETIEGANLKRIKKYGGGIAIQDRMFFQGEHFSERYGVVKAAQAPPIRKIMQLGIPLGIGTDGTRVSSYNPMLALYWLVSGKTWSGLQLYSVENRLSRYEALQLMTSGSAWFSGEEKQKGQIEPGMFADLVLLSADYFAIPEDKIKDLVSVLTIVNGKIVYADQEYKSLCPAIAEVIPSWSPVRYYGGYQAQ